jgi:DNA-binding XRE family transcriptional regulator
VARQMLELRVHPVRLRRRMAELGLSTRSLASRVGCARTTIVMLGNGSRILTSKETAEAIERELKQQPGDYFAVPEVIADPRQTSDQESAAPVDEHLPAPEAAA